MNLGETKGAKFRYLGARAKKKMAQKKNLTKLKGPNKGKGASN